MIQSEADWLDTLVGLSILNPAEKDTLMKTRPWLSTRTLSNPFLKCWIVVTACATIGGCHESGEVSASSPQHDMNQPVFHAEGAGGLFADLTEQEYRLYMAPLVGVEPGTVVSRQDKLTEKAQTWLNIFDNEMRKRHPEALENIPVPKAKVIGTPETNAFVGKVVSCFKGLVDTNSGRGADWSKAGFLDYGSSEVVYFDQEEFDSQLASVPCRPLTGANYDEIARYADAFNHEFAPSCTMTASGGASNPAIHFKGSCGSSGRTRDLYMLQVSSIVHFYLGAFQSFDEGQFAALVAHELGHYYRTHGIEDSAKFDYFYKLAASNSSGRPRRDASLDPLIPRVKMSSQLIENLSRIRRLPQQKTHPAFYMTVSTLVNNLCNSLTGCPSECRHLHGQLKDNSYMRELGAFPFADVPLNKQFLFRNHEQEALACLDKIAVDDVELALSHVLTAAMTPEWPGFLVGSSNGYLQYLISELSQFISEYVAIYSQMNADGLAELKNYGDLVVSLDQGLEQLEGQANDLYERIYREHLGQYTSEQEADEFSVEWLTKVGVPPKKAAQVYLEFTKYSGGIDSGSPFRDLDFTPCHELYLNDWNDRDGQPFFVAMGNLLDTHHGSCYRAFNVDREIIAHRLTPSVPPPAVMNELEWSVLQDHAKGLASDTESLVGDSPARAFGSSWLAGSLFKAKAITIRPKPEASLIDRVGHEHGRLGHQRVFSVIEPCTFARPNAGSLELEVERSTL